MWNVLPRVQSTFHLSLGGAIILPRAALRVVFPRGVAKGALDGKDYSIYDTFLGSLR